MNIKRWYEWKEIKEIQKDINEGSSIAINGLSDTQRHHLVSSLIEGVGKKALYIAANDLQARKAFRNLESLFGERVYYFPFREKMLYDVESKSREQTFQRIECLGRLLESDYTAVVLSCESIIDYYMPPDEFKSYFVSLKAGDTVNLEELIHRLAAAGYEREEMVEARGQFSVRGGIIDVFPVQYEKPVRIELFDIEIDSMRIFDVESQRSYQNVEQVRIFPAKEFVFTEEQAHRITERLDAELNEYLSRINDRDLTALFRSNFGRYAEKLKNSGNFAGIDKFIPYFYDSRHSIFEYICSNTVIFVEDTERLKQRLENVIEEHVQQCEILIEKGMVLPGTFDMYFNPKTLSSLIGNIQAVYLNSLDEGESLAGIRRSHLITGKNIEPYRGHLEQLKKDIKNWISGEYQVTLLASTDKRKSGLKELLAEENINVYSDEPPGNIPCVIVRQGQLENGFIYPQIRWAVVTESDIISAAVKKPEIKIEGARKIKAFTDLKVGDYVVHQMHGIGLYTGIETLTVEGVKREYLKVEYRDGGFLYIPVTQMELIQKYIGTEGRTPRLNKLGGTEWIREKKKVKESLKELAADLIKLQAERETRKGFAFSPDTVWQKQFEDLFPYNETKDQLRCAEEIKRDMETDKIMDRLLCGDVGYGKTEVALRAVFKAAMDGKQSAFLVPTTVLASQHFDNFKRRFAPFPITVEMLSRFRTPSEQKRIIRGLKSGLIDVVVGTHKLFNKEVKFKDLGLLVIDEEQRFGVEHKEKIKSMYPSVDILTLSATPIPRTLHMSLTGLRDISTIEEPPEQRYPVQTYILEYRDDVVEDAIKREIARDGQVFYLYNRVKGIQAKAAQLQELVPQAKIGYAHGQMSERQLEKVILSFLNREFDVLVCTTIIENGIDMPNVNTIIVENANRLGLAQLYQLRGRVGRSNRLAYAYLTYRKDKVLNEIAEKRLKAIREFTEFGSGFKIAMRDLQIRGAGNLLGPEQHGHMEAVGYDTYIKLLDEAVKELKGQTHIEEEKEVFVEFKMDAYLEKTYIADEKARLDMYKTIAALETEEEAIDLRDELIDRYGNIPEAASNLIDIALVKNMAGECGFNMIKQKEDMVVLYFADKNNLPLALLNELISKEKGKLMFSAGKNPYLSYRVKGTSNREALNNIKILLQDILKLKSG
ncbi:MAG: transcription-repair coupling factor [Clostridiaceae bacterium]|nr:transcription-repair coupling factor [Clostridiaceae bacterium]